MTHFNTLPDRQSATRTNDLADARSKARPGQTIIVAPAYCKNPEWAIIDTDELATWPYRPAGEDRSMRWDTWERVA